MTGKQALKLVNLYEAYIKADSVIQTQNITIAKQSVLVDSLSASNNKQADLIIGLNLVVENLNETNGKEQEKTENYADLWKHERKKKIIWGVGGSCIGLGLGFIIGAIIAN